MKATRILGVLVAAILLTTFTLSAARVGEPAPGFTGTDTKGKAHALADYKGRFVVLEWHNRDCPFVKKHYGSGNMQALQKEWTEKGVVWLTIISSAPGQQGHQTADAANAFFAGQKWAGSAIILDPQGKIGHLYEAKTTPHMYVIDPNGRLVYNGAIDDKPTSDVADVPTAKNFVGAALTEAMAGKPVTTPTSRPYGCSVKYATSSE
ncbi:MAG: thioredoxin family protein [Vicinamibacteraceae bacterium]|nr:thioredoxin family protein [Vicinamibacteraceae bacterium]